VFSNVVDDVVAVMSEGKQLKLIQVDTGRVLADLSVTSVNAPRNLFLRYSHGHFLVITDAVDPENPEFDPVMDALPVFGRVYSISEQSMTLAWEQSIDRYHLRRTIPDRSALLPNAPVLVLLSRGGNTIPGSAVRRVRFGALVLDVRTGKELYRDNDVGITLNDLWLNIDAAKKTLMLSLERRIVTLNYSAGEPD
jgi:hypothetical protein